jgi:dTDP-4-dehydrorhamnose reductase
MKLLITGGTGKLGKQLVRLFPESLHPTHQELELGDRLLVDDYLATHRPEILIHLAAWIDVRGCEIDRHKAWQTNVVSTENLVEACQHHVRECYFIYMSSACVFRGDRGDYIETDVPYPDNFYGLTKLLGEFIVKKMTTHLILRANFVAREKWKYEKAFTDRFGTYLFADDLALAIKDVVKMKLEGIVHIAGKEKISMFDLARITTPSIKPMTIADVNLPLPCDMSLRSVWIRPYELRRILPGE